MQEGWGWGGVTSPGVRTVRVCVKGRASIKTEEKAFLGAGQGRAFASEGAQGGRAGRGSRRRGPRPRAGWAREGAS